MKKVLTIGGATQDIFLEYICPPELHQSGYVLLPIGKKLEVKDLVYATGGGATNAATSFARLGFTTESFFKIGTDTAGDMLLKALHTNHIATTHVIRSHEVQTGTSFIIPCPSGERTVLVYRGANTTLQQQELPLHIIDTHDIVYITSLSETTASLIVPIATHAAAHKKLVATNPGTSQLIDGARYLHDALPYIDILILNSHEAQLLAQTFNKKPHSISLEVKSDLPPLLNSENKLNILEFFAIIHNQGVQTIVVTNGADGVYVFNQNTIYYHPAPQVEVISTIGAGDAFGSSFVAYLAQNKPVEDAIRAGIIQSGSVLQYTDAKTGLLPLQKLDQQMAQLNKQLLQKFMVKK